MKRPYDAQFERQSNYTNFAINLLDQRHDIERKLHTQESIGLREDFSCHGFHTESFEPPEFLDSYIRPATPLTIDVAATIDTSGTVTFNNMQLYPEDNAPLSIESDEQFAIVRQGGEVVAMLFDTTAIEATLRQLLPHHARPFASADQILRYIDKNATTLTNTAELAIQTDTLTGTVAFSKIETVDDSIETLSVISQRPHPSGNDILARLALTESINRRRLGTNTNHISRNLTLEVLRRDASSIEDWSIEELINAPLHKNSVMHIDTATRDHIGQIADVLANIPTPESL